MTSPAVAEAAAGAREVFSILPALAVVLPAIGALLVHLTGDRNERVRDFIAIAFSSAAFVAVAAMFKRVLLEGQALSAGLPVIIGVFRLGADAMAFLFALVASFMWMLSTIYSFGYIRHEQHRTRYHTFALLTEAAALGVFLAGDFFSLFVFFELMGMLAYLLVIHTQTDEARRAGTRYIFMTVYGGLSLLMGVFLLLSCTGGVGFLPDADSQYLTTGICFIVAGFMIAGFGVKAGMVPLHVWLPLAHPAAPSPASALLSGVMLKAGAYGMLRVVGSFHAQRYYQEGPKALSGEKVAQAIDQAPVFIQNMSSLGAILIVFAVLTMVVGMALATVQSNAKRLLAYSSISQMGFVILGIGIGAYMGPAGATGLSGSIYHIINHAMFKSLLFLGIGAVYYRVHHLDLNTMGGLWRKMPLTALFTCVAGLGIMGITLFNGYCSKTLLHHAVVKTSYLAGDWARVLDVFFIVTAGGTVCYITKLLVMVFFGRYRGDDTKAFESLKDPPASMLAGMGVLAAGVILFGIFPILVLRVFAVPVLQGFAYLDPYGIAYLLKEKFFILKEMKGILPPLVIGLSFFLAARRWNLFDIRLPNLCCIDFYYSKAESGLLRLCASGSWYCSCAGSFAYTRFALSGVRLVLCIPALFHSYASYILRRSGRLGCYLRGRWTCEEEHRRCLTADLSRRAAALWRDVRSSGGFIGARHFVEDIAFGVIAITLIIGLLAITL